MIDVDVVLVLPAVAVEPLPEIALVVVEADADERNAEVRRALDVVAGEDAEAAGVDRQRLVQPELGREVRDRPRPEHAGVPRAPGVLRAQVLLHPAVGVVDAAVQRELRRALLELVDRHLLQQRDRVVVAARARAPDRARGTGSSYPCPSSTRGSAPARSSRWCAGATNWPSVRASLTIGASCAPAVDQHADIVRR